MQIKIAVIGLGYVGLPLALAFARKYPGTRGFDISTSKIEKLRAGIDPNAEGLDCEIKQSSLQYCTNATELAGANFFVIGVPTPVDLNHNPDLGPLLRASGLVGGLLKGGETVVYESTVYPGVTEDVCGDVLERVSGLKSGIDFKLAYSPERINPGDQEHSLTNVIKVVSGQDSDTLDLVSQVYGSIIKAGVYKAPSIKVAEAAKVIENTQRDLNIALMNELAIIFDKIGISTREVLAAAGSKWNFLKFSPGLVGGHCIGVDPYYLTTMAEQLGYHPQVILAGRRINDGMGSYVGQRIVKLLVNNGIQPKGARVGIFGLTFKENVTDIRNSRVPDIVKELKEFGIQTLLHDPMAEAAQAKHEYGFELSDWSELVNLDAIILAVAHRDYLEQPVASLIKGLNKNGVIADIKSALDPKALPSSIHYWSL